MDNLNRQDYHRSLPDTAVLSPVNHLAALSEMPSIASDRSVRLRDDRMLSGLAPGEVMGHRSAVGEESFSEGNGHGNVRYHCPVPFGPIPLLGQSSLGPNSENLHPHSSPFLSTEPTNYTYRSICNPWTSEESVRYGMLPDECCGAVASICTERAEDYSEFRHHGRLDMFPHLLCDVNGIGHMVMVNNYDPGQIDNSGSQSCSAFSQEPLYHTTSQGIATQLSYFYTEDMGHLAGSCQMRMEPSPVAAGPCPGPSQPQLSSVGFPSMQPAPSFLPFSSSYIPPSSCGSHVKVNHMAASYGSGQSHDAVCPMLPNTQAVVADENLTGPIPSGMYLEKLKKPCNCTKSQCLKLYCDCFANGETCINCNCINCYNNVYHAPERYKAIRLCLDRNPEAFQPKIGNRALGHINKGRHNKGCNCKRSGCLKNYCECYEAKIMCSSVCKCVDCRNYAGSPERETAVWAGTDPRGHRVNSLKNKGHLACITADVVEATCGCLLAQAEEAEKEGYALAQAERMILEEFGQCLTQIVRSIFKSSSGQL